MVSLEGVSFRRADKVILENVSLTIPRHKVTVIMGPSGTGKTTLLRLISGQLKPQAGKVWVNNAIVNELDRNALYTMRKQLGMLFQNSALFTDLTVFDNVAYPLREHTPLSETMIRDIVLFKLESVGLRGAKALMPSALSGGMARRVALARAIALDPKLILYDEPFTGQDPITMAVLVKLIRLFNDALGMTSVVVTHDVHEAMTIADKIYLIAEGHIIGKGTPDELKNSTQAQVKQFIRGLPDGPVGYHYPAKSYTDDLGISV